ncbi:MAG: tetratricopeptide repeat protein [Chakrabartia sp.]
MTQNSPARATDTPIPNSNIAEELYQRGHDALNSGDNALAIKAFTLSCDAGNFKSCHNVALLHEARLAGDPKLENSNFKIAISYFNRSCAGGFQRACVAAAHYYRSSKYGMKNAARATALLTTACDAGEIAGCEDLAEILYLGDGVAMDLAHAATLFKKGCDADGRAMSCFNYGLMRSKGQGVAIDKDLAFEYYSLGCRKGSNEACINLAVDYNEHGIVPDDKKIARGLLQQSCTKGAMTACANLGQLIRDGKPTEAENVEAAELFRKACDSGFGKACRSLGNMAQDGIKAAGTMRQAIKYYIKGCNLNYADSCYNVGLVYWSGYRVVKQPRTSLFWHGKGCNLGSASSCVGAALAALSLKKGDPLGGKDIARRWFDQAKTIDPENSLVKSMGDWLDKP